MAARAPKRALGEGEDYQVGEKKTRVEDPDSHEVRILVASQQVGSIIGRKGSNITRVRTECSVYMSVLSAPDGVRERVLTVKGHSENIASAIREIGAIIIESQQQRAAKQGTDTTDGKSDTFQVRFLLHSSLVGGIIGKRGALVQATQQNTGARVQVSTEPLPQSSEKTVTVSGALDNVYAALQIVVPQIKDNELRPGVQNYPYQPSPFGAPAMSSPYQPSPYAAPSPYGGQYQGYAAPTYPPAQSYAPPPQQAGFSAQSGGQSQQKIVIPTVCAGNVIGRRGTIISGIKQQSGTFISIAPPENTAPHERQVTISGSIQGIQTAVFLIRQIVEQYEGPAQAQY